MFTVFLRKRRLCVICTLKIYPKKHCIEVAPYLQHRSSMQIPPFSIDNFTLLHVFHFGVLYTIMHYVNDAFCLLYTLSLSAPQAHETSTPTHLPFSERSPKREMWKAFMDDSSFGLSLPQKRGGNFHYKVCARSAYGYDRSGDTSVRMCNKQTVIAPYSLELREINWMPRVKKGPRMIAQACLVA